MGEWLIRKVIDEPAEVALWKGPNGRLTRYLISLSRNNIAKLLEASAKIALDDKQLKRVEDDIIVDDKPVPVFALSYKNSNTLFFAAQGDRMIILSDIDMLTEGDGKISIKTKELLSGLLSREKKSQMIYIDQFKLRGNKSEHLVVATAPYLSFGYQYFFPAMQAIRFDFGKDGWSTQVMIDVEKLPKEELNTVSLWKMMPADPGVSVALPVNWSASEELLRSFGADKNQVSRILSVVDSPIGAGWYAKSHLHAPLFVVPLKAPLAPSEIQFLAKLFEEVIGSKESAVEGEGYKRFPVMTLRNGSDGWLWQRDVTSRYGNKKWEEAEDRGFGREKGFFRVSLASNKKSLVFSPDDALVEDTLAVADKKRPAIGDSLPRNSSVLAFISPVSFSVLIRKETLWSLPADREPIFRGVVNERLLPKLAAMKKYPDYILVLNEQDQPISGQWLPVTWQALQKG
jgi:uncharacterized protein YfaA (DUF2138 family)